MNIWYKTLLGMLALLVILATSCKRENKTDKTELATSGMDSVQQYQASWESVAKHPVPQWFDDAKFGIFVIWGPYSVPAWRPPSGRPAYTEHFVQFMYRDTTTYYPYLRERFGAAPPEFGYKDICRMFKGEKFDPDSWASLFEKAGAKYVIQIGEFHGGFAMWDSELTEWDAVDMGPNRDIVGEVGKAVRARGLKYGVSTHRERHYQFYSKDKRMGGVPHDHIAEEIVNDPSSASLYGPFQISDLYMQDHTKRWEEIIDKYHPDFMWLDAFAGKEDWHWTLWREHCVGMISDYLNQAEERGQEVYFNNKGRTRNWPVEAGAGSADNLSLDGIGAKWENPATMSTSYAFCEQEEEGDYYRTPTQLIQLLCDIVSKNGNLLLSIGPKGDGTISERQQTRLLAMGKWLNTNGEAIYATRPWKIYGEGEGEPGPMVRHHIPIRPKEIRYTRKENAVYALSLVEPNFPLVLSETKGIGASKIKSIELLGSDQQVEWEVTDAGISIEGTKGLAGEHVWAFKIEFEESMGG